MHTGAAKSPVRLAVKPPTTSWLAASSREGGLTYSYYVKFSISLVAMALLMGSVSACGGETFTAGDQEAWEIFCRDEYVAPILATSTTTTSAPPRFVDGKQVYVVPKHDPVVIVGPLCTRLARDISNRIKEGWSKSCATTYYKQKILEQNPDPYMCE